ncbi:MAG: aminomethyl-transferring glycine dehydrogenase [Cytophagales bacterium]|nr:aminomethyl-transferring glycine dehydrogenase [Bernardetiaceae bacterium]MDW8211516.1 aminomethyl-transferring glycine dehydrogenase [Cytophagales bacterium]
MKLHLHYKDLFSQRHIGPDEAQIKHMLKVVNAPSVEALMRETIPSGIYDSSPLSLPSPQTEEAFLDHFKKIVEQNQIFKSYIGLGYHPCFTPPVILRNILENPGWYTAYTPYQAEIAQGRLEMLLNFQTMIIELTGMEMANASLLDEATAAAEAMSLLYAVRPKEKKEAYRFFVSDNCLPQTIDVLKTRAQPLGIELIIGNHCEVDIADELLFGALLQYPGANGKVEDYTDFIAALHDKQVLCAIACDLMALVLLKSPGEMGADVAVGSAQRFGVPMGYGGPHAAFFATKDIYKRQIPGRIIGISKDAHGKPAYRMALQTREQHIRREKATSNICTAQVLLAIVSAAYAMYHGPKRLKAIAQRIHGLAVVLSQALKKLGYQLAHEHFFDTLQINSHAELTAVIRRLAEEKRINLQYDLAPPHIGIALNETTTLSDLTELVTIFAKARNTTLQFSLSADEVESPLPEALWRTSDFLAHPVFNTYHSEHEMLRYLKQLENKDFSLVHGMIPLGSCTMKLNAAAEMIPITWPELNQLHPFAPIEQAKGYQEIFRSLEQWLCQITGLEAVSFQPNSGAQGEYTGLMVIRAYHQDRGQGHRNVALIPSSAHGTNPASAVMAGMRVVVVKCDEEGNIDLADLKAKAEAHSHELACLMVTYPSTHGVFEEEIQQICDIIHQHGGQVYMDGANMNAQVGLTSPKAIGADVCHLNLHKTFCIPHGGGGPGMGPIVVARHLAPYLPGHVFVKTGGERAISAVSAAPFGSASILAISYAYISMMGAEGLKRASEIAILNANYIKDRLKDYYPILYLGKNGRCAHEMIIDCRPFKSIGIDVEDIAKRLMDYGFHAPTISFPVPGTMMIEPTESETLQELDRFCQAMIAIRKEIAEIEQGTADRHNNVLRNAPHTADMLLSEQWDKPYSRQKAAYPLPHLRANKFWPPVSRIDNAYGDRNLVCTCAPVAAYEMQEVPLR